MNARRTPLYLERETYRRRRIMDGARVLPVLAFVLILLPVLWTPSGMGTADEALYLFAVWLGLIVVAAALSRPLRAAQRREIVRPTQSPAVTDPAVTDPAVTDPAASDPAKGPAA